MNNEVTKKILLVEDEAITAMLQKRKLEKYGYIVHYVINGEDAIKTALNKISKYDLILMDIDLGSGIDGTRAAELILKEKDIPIVFLSSHTEREIVERTEKITSYGYVVKNSGTVVLDASIKMALKLFAAKKEVDKHQKNLIEINRIGKLVNSTLDLDMVLNLILKQTLKALGTSVGMIFLYSSDTKTLTWGAALGLSDEFVNEFSTTPIQLGEGLTGIIAQTGKPIFISGDSSFDSRIVRKVIQQEGLNSFIGVPILADDQVVGVMNILTRPPLRLTEENVYFCSAIGMQAGWAINNARLYAEQNKIREELIATQQITKDSEEKFRQITESMKEVFWLRNANNAEMLYISPSYEKVWGRSCQSLYENPKSFIDTVIDEDRPQVFAEFEKYMKGDKFDLEYRIARPNGEIRWVRAQSFPVLNDEGAIVRHTGFAMDITDRKKIEEDLKKSEESCRNKIKSILEPEGDIGILSLGDILDRKVLQSMMDVFYQITKIPNAIVDLEGQHLVHSGWQDICTKFHRVHPDTMKNCHEAATSLAKGIDYGTFKAYHCKNNLWDIVTPIVINGKHMGNIFVGQFFYEDETPDYSLFIDQAHKYGFNEDEYLAALDNVPRLDRKIVEAAMVFCSKLADIISSLSYSSIQLARTLTQQKENKYELKRQLSEKEFILKEVHHRIKNSIASIESLLLLHADSTDNSDVKTALQEAATYVQSTRVLYENLLTSNEYHEISIKNYIDSLIDSIISISHESKIVSIDRNITDFKTSTKKLIPVGIIINELITNCFKHSFKQKVRGSIVIELSKKTQTHAVLTIKDNGTGIDEKILESKSPGLGLTIVKFLIKELKGSYSFTNENGTKICIEFEI